MKRRSTCTGVGSLLDKMLFKRTEWSATEQLIAEADAVDMKLEAIIQRGPADKDLSRKYNATKALRAIHRDRLRSRISALGTRATDPDPNWKDIEIGAIFIEQWLTGARTSLVSLQLDEFADSIQFESGTEMDHLQAVISRWNSDDGFQGNSDAYYSADNSYLSRVLQSRKGIPISLSVIFAAVCRRRGIPISLIGFPGNFLVAYTPQAPRSSSPIFIDVFRSCQIRSQKTLSELIGAYDNSVLEPVSPTEVRRSPICPFGEITYLLFHSATREWCAT